MSNTSYPQRPISARTSGQQRGMQSAARPPQRQRNATAATSRAVKQGIPVVPPAGATRQNATSGGSVPQRQNSAPRKQPPRKKKGTGRRRRRTALLILLLILVLIIVCCTRCSSCRSISGESDVLQANAPAETTTVTEDTNAAVDVGTGTSELEATTGESNPGGSIHVIATGDNLVQTAVYNSAAAHAESGEDYNFGYVYDGVYDLIAGANADLRIINQETLICDSEDIAISGSDYNFNSPPEVGEALWNLGFNVISMSNNHLLDKGVDGLSACMDYWDGMMEQHTDLLTYGVYRDEDDMNNIRIKEVNGLKVAFLAYTENINGYTVPEDSTIQIILTSQDDVIQEQIEKANELADIVIVSAHWGVEDTFEVTDGVKAQAQNMIEWGADVILGNHSHVPQTMEYLTRSDGTQGFVFYSMGNFVSAQTYNINIVGEVGDFELVCDAETGQVTVENVQVRPVITQYDDASLSNLRLIAYKDYTEELAAEHGLPYAMSGDYGVWDMSTIQDIINVAIPEEYQKLD